MPRPRALAVARRWYGPHCPLEGREKGLHTGVKKGCTTGKAERWLASQITRAHGAQGDGSVRDCGTFRTQSTYRCRVMEAAVAMCCRWGFMHPRYRVGRLPKAKTAWDSVSAMSARRVSMSVHVAGGGVPARPAGRAVALGDVTLALGTQCSSGDSEPIRPTPHRSSCQPAPASSACRGVPGGV